MKTTRFLVTPPDWTSQLDLETLFTPPAPPPGAPLAVDVGCGKGGYLAAAAAAEPATRFLGIDRLLVRLRKVDSKLRRAGLDNVRLLRIEAAYAIRYLLPPGSVRRYTLFFPDPWPKRRHHRRRLVQPGFLDDLCRTLAPGGAFYVASDHLDYFADITARFDADPRFERIAPLIPSPAERSEFEAQFIAQGLTIGRAGFRRP